MIPNPHKSKFILFEGIDGSGKSEQYIRTQNYLNAFWPKQLVRYCKEPDINRPVGKQIYEIIGGRHSELSMEKMKPFHLQAFYIEDRMTNYRDNIIYGLQNGAHVIQDRGVPSSLCYGSESKDDFFDYMGLHNRVFSSAQVPFFWPDLILIYDVPADKAVQRMVDSGKSLDKFETEAKLQSVRDNYIQFSKIYPNCVIIDAEPDPQEIFVLTKTNILSTLGLNDR